MTYKIPGRMVMKSNKPSILRTFESQADPKHTALVVVDVQNDFVHPDGLAKRTVYHTYGKRPEDLWKELPLLPRMVERLPRVIEAARNAVCLVVFVRGIYDTEYVSDSYAARLGMKDLYGEICISGTWGADFFGDIQPKVGPRELIVTKHRYSAFWGTDLNLVLRSNGIKTVVMTGVATSVCVESTTRDAFFNDYYVVAVEDACADYDGEAHEATLRALRRSFGHVVGVDDIVGLWSGERTASTGDAAVVSGTPR